MAFSRLSSHMDRLVDAYRRPKVRLALNLTGAAIAATAVALTVQHFAGTGWPLTSADPILVLGAGLLFLLAYAFKAYGWQRLFARHERPRPVTLALAGSAACVTGVALPGRLDDAVRIAVIRRTGCRTGVRALALSLFLLGLVDAVALMPLASAGASLTTSTALRVGLIVVASGGVGAGLVLAVLPRAVASTRLARFRLARWLEQHTASVRDSLQAGLLVLASWVIRTAGLALLLGALGFGISFPLAILFLTAAAASSALPVAPAGAATQVGAGAGILSASGMTASKALAFALSAQLLVILAGAVVITAFTVWQAGRRLRPVAAY
jgi:uncharacterized membrane protein YbhN (UPF0104 family)